MGKARAKLSRGPHNLREGSDGTRTIKVWEAEDPTPEFQAAWRDLADKRALVWQRREARECMPSSAWFAAVWHYSRLIETDPPREASFFNRGSAYGGLQQWEKAAADFARATELPKADMLDWSLLALLRLQLGDVDGYRQAITTLLQRFGTTTNPADANIVAWTCVYKPNGVTDFNRPLQLAQLAVGKERKDPNTLNTLGAVLYRAGRSEESVQTLNEAIQKSDGKGIWADWLFLALAHHKLGHANEARQSLDKAVQWYEQASKEKPGGDAVGPLNWDQQIEFNLLRREAEALLGIPPGPPRRLEYVK